MKLLDVLKGVTQNDLDEIDTKINDLEGELDGLREVQKLVKVKLHGKPERKKPVRRARTPKDGDDGDADGDAGYEKKAKIAAYLSERGASQIRDIAAGCGLPPQGLHNYLNCPYFTKSSQGYHLTPEGRQALL